MEFGSLKEYIGCRVGYGLPKLIMIQSSTKDLIVSKVFEYVNDLNDP